MIAIYRSAFHYFGRSLPFLLAMAALIEGLTLLFPSKGIEGGRMVFLFLMAYYFHRHFLYGELLTWKASLVSAPPAKFGWFLIASFVMIFAAVAMSITAAIISVGPLGSAGYETFVGATVIFMMPAYLLLLSLFGLGLPAIVARNRAYRLTTGLKAGPRLALGLIFGPGVTGGLILALTLLAFPRLATLPALQASFGEWALGTLATTLGFLPTILAVAVLCQAYRRAYPPEA